MRLGAPDLSETINISETNYIFTNAMNEMLKLTT